MQQHVACLKKTDLAAMKMAEVLVETNQDDEEKTVINQFSIIGAMIPQSDRGKRQG